VKKGFFIASTGQNIGKTTTCLGLFSKLRKKFPRIGYMKPVGQEHVMTQEGISVDKDVLLFKEHFSLQDPFAHMSPVLVPSGFTRDFLDQKIAVDTLKEKISTSFAHIEKQHDFVLVEGTGHCGVGSIIQLNNAQAAKLLDLPVLLIASGGLGSAFDELALNKCICDRFHVEIVGIILNRVLPHKMSMIDTYMRKALQSWNIPLLGCIPYDPLLANPSMKDLEVLFNTYLLSGEEHRMRHFARIHLVATSADAYRETIAENQLIITPAVREDIIAATLARHWEYKEQNEGKELRLGLILTGSYIPRHHRVEEIQKARIPLLYIPLHSDTAMQMIHSFTAKIRTEDIEKVEEAIDIVERHIDFKHLN
jgi:hypothetical protein